MNSKATLSIGDREDHIQGIRVPLHRAVLDQTADAHFGTHRCLTVNDLLRGVEQIDVLAQGVDRQPHRHGQAREHRQHHE